MFTRDDVRWLSETVSSIYAASSLDTLTTAAMHALDERFRLHSFACEQIGIETPSYQLHKLRAGAKPPADHATFLHDHPFNHVLRRVSKSRPEVFHMRGQIHVGRWQRTDHYNGIARPMGWNDQLLLLGYTLRTFFMVGLYRDKPFSSSESFLARLLRPHVSAGWMRAQGSGSNRDSAEGTLLLSAGLRPIRLSAVQSKMLRAYFPGWKPRTSELPDPLRIWVAQSNAILREQPPRRPLFAFNAEGIGGILWVRCFPQPDGRVLLRFTEQLISPSFVDLRRDGLTTRECEVVHWMAQGKRDLEIATILNCAAATISKHVEHVLKKLQVENRSAAVSAARACLARGTTG